jgi:hypothetical protein
MDLQVPPKLISLQSCTELLEARETSGSPDDEKTKVTTATIAMHAMATAPIRTTRVRLSGKCVASMTSFRMLLRRQRTTTGLERVGTCFSVRVRRLWRRGGKQRRQQRPRLHQTFGLWLFTKAASLRKNNKNTVLFIFGRGFRILSSTTAEFPFYYYSSTVLDSS